MSDIDRIQELVSEYNKAEAEQNARLWELFKLIQKRKGYREVRFPAGAWTNCWGWERDDLSYRVVKDMTAPIVEIVPGDE